MDILEKIKIKRDIQLEDELKSFKQPSLKKALNQKGIQIIGEIKRASPSKGKISRNTDFEERFYLYSVSSGSC